MSKEIFISSTPHETRLAIVEDEALTEIYYERENEYTLAGSIYNGRVTRVLPGMQSSFVEIGLERDAFLYITDFMEEAPDPEEFDTTPAGDRAARAPRLGNGEQPDEWRAGPRSVAAEDGAADATAIATRSKCRASGRPRRSAAPAGRRARRGRKQRRRRYGPQRVQRRLRDWRRRSRRRWKPPLAGTAGTASRARRIRPGRRYGGPGGR